MLLFVHSNGQKLGPLPLEEVNRQLQAAQLLPDDLAWHEGLPTWIPLRTVQGVVIPAGSSMGPVATVPSGVPPVILPSPAVVPTAGADPLAICSLVFGILGVVCCAFLLPSVAAVVCGHISLANFKKNARLEGRGLAIAGLILGYVGIVIGLVYVVFAFGMSFVSAFTEGMK